MRIINLYLEAIENGDEQALIDLLKLITPL
jgi:hypothetical protein